MSSFFKVTALEPWWDGSILLVCVLDLWDTELLLLLHTQNGWKIMKGKKLFVPRVGTRVCLVCLLDTRLLIHWSASFSAVSFLESLIPST